MRSNDPSQTEQFGADLQLVLLGGFDVDFKSYLIVLEVEVHDHALLGQTGLLANQQDPLVLQVREQRGFHLRVGRGGDE